MPEMQLMLVQASQGADFSYPDVEGVIANSRWEEELPLPRVASVQRAPAQPGAHTPASPRQQTGSGKQRGDPNSCRQRQGWRGRPHAREPEQRSGSPLPAMQEQIEQAVGLVTHAGWPEDIPCSHLATSHRLCTSSQSLTRHRARPGDPARPESGARPTACARTVPNV